MLRALWPRGVPRHPPLFPEHCGVLPADRRGSGTMAISNTRLLIAAPSTALSPDDTQFIHQAQASGNWTFLDHGVREEQEKGGGMMVLIIVIAVVSVIVLFSVQNAAPVIVSFLSWKFEASLAVIILLCVLTGILIGGALVSFWRLKRSIKKRKTRVPGPLDGEKQP
jgi:uncharacterized integral membrane protein